MRASGVSSSLNTIVVPWSTPGGSGSGGAGEPSGSGGRGGSTGRTGSSPMRVASLRSFSVPGARVAVIA